MRNAEFVLDGRKKHKMHFQSAEKLHRLRFQFSSVASLLRFSTKFEMISRKKHMQCDYVCVCTRVNEWKRLIGLLVTADATTAFFSPLTFEFKTHSNSFHWMSWSLPEQNCRQSEWGRRKRNINSYNRHSLQHLFYFRRSHHESSDTRVSHVWLCAQTYLVVPRLVSNPLHMVLDKLFAYLKIEEK